MSCLWRAELGVDFVRPVAIGAFDEAHAAYDLWTGVGGDETTGVRKSVRNGGIAPDARNLLHETPAAMVIASLFEHT